MAHVRILVQARRRRAPPAMEHPAPAAAGLADVVRRAGGPSGPAVVFAFARTVAAERAHSDGAPGNKSLSGQAADLCARTVLRLRLCPRRGKGDGPMVGPAIAGTLLPRGAFERRMILLTSAHRERNCSRAR